MEAINEYKSIAYKISELELRITLYETKLYSAGGSSFGSDIRSQRNPYENKMLYWIEKIDEVKTTISKLELKIKPFLAFWSHLNEIEQQILKLLLIERISATKVADYLKINKNKIFDIKFEITKKWNSF